MTTEKRVHNESPEYLAKMVTDLIMQLTDPIRRDIRDLGYMVTDLRDEVYHRKGKTKPCPDCKKVHPHFEYRACRIELCEALDENSPLVRVSSGIFLAKHYSMIDSLLGYVDKALEAD